MKNQKDKGITLVALVITIIILLILAGITIIQLTNSGLFKNAKSAKERSDNAQKLENNTLTEYESEIGKYVNGTRETDGSTTDYKSDGTEIKTNEKIDGKPVYARYFDIQISSNGWYYKEHNINNVDKIWIDIGNSYTVDEDNNEEYYCYLPTIGGGTSYKVGKTKVGNYSISSYWNGKISTLLLKYTKTTD